MVSVAIKIGLIRATETRKSALSLEWSLRRLLQRMCCSVSSIIPNPLLQRWSSSSGCIFCLWPPSFGSECTLWRVILSLLGDGALLAVFFGLTLGSLYTWSVIFGLSTAVILWLTSHSILAGARRVLSLLQQSPIGATVVPLSLSVNTTQGL